jgi:hypothetical protein
LGSGLYAIDAKKPGQVDMIYHKLLLSITFIAFFLAHADAQQSMLVDVESLGFAGDSAGDPLDPSQLGESMSMPLPQELIQDARKAGVITESNPLNKPDTEQRSFSVLPRPEADEDNSLHNVNITGAWSFNLKGKAPEQIKLYLIQDKDTVIGQGAINRRNGTEKATANGAISGEKMTLTVMSGEVSNLYKLNLSLSSLAAGTYTAYMADGSSRSGKVTFAVSSNIFKPASSVAEDGAGAYATSDSASATPKSLDGLGKYPKRR